jgi:hypothetical protein
VPAGKVPSIRDEDIRQKEPAMKAIRLLPACLVAIAAPLALSLALARPADADYSYLQPPLPADATDSTCDGEGSGTVCRFDLTVHVPLEPHADCADVVLQATADAPGTYVWYYDPAGQLAYESIVYSWTGSIVNPLTGASVAYSGQGMKTTDFVEGLGSYTFLTHVPAGDIVAFVRGRSAFDPETSVTLSDTPEGQDAYAAQVCALLPTDSTLLPPQPGRLGQPY